MCNHPGLLPIECRKICKSAIIGGFCYTIRTFKKGILCWADFRIVIADDRCDRTIAAESLMEGARFFEDVGVKERALKFYRFLIRCNDLRRWKLDREVSVANAKIADLLLN